MSLDVSSVYDLPELWIGPPLNCAHYVQIFFLSFYGLSNINRLPLSTSSPCG